MTVMRIGVDFGGTKIEVAAIDEEGEFAARVRCPTPDNYEEALEAVSGLLQEVERRTGEFGHFGIGIPGTASPETGIVRNANALYLNGRCVASDLETATGRRVRLNNDANCFAISEARDGAAKGAAVVFGAILGTGCGGGVVVHGKPLVGRHGLGGEWGHNPLPSPRDEELPPILCWCGSSNCLESWISGSGFARDFQIRTQRALRAEQVVQAARSGDTAAAVALERYIDRLGRALATVVNIVDPDVIVLGGGMSNTSELYERLPQAMSPHVFLDHCDTPVRQSVWGDSSGVRGAAQMWES